MRAYGGGGRRGAASLNMDEFPGRDGRDSPPPPARACRNPKLSYPGWSPAAIYKLTSYRDWAELPRRAQWASRVGRQQGPRSCALSTADSLAFALGRRGFDLRCLLFGLPRSGQRSRRASRTFTWNDVARKELARAHRPGSCGAPERKSVQALVHCIGSMTLFMAILAGEKRVRSVVASQLAAHPITNWFNYAKSE